MNSPGNSLHPPRTGGIVSRIVGALAGAVVLIVSLVFSVALFAVLAVLGLGVFGYLWWKTRALRRALREQRERAHGRIIEGAEIVEVQDAQLAPPNVADARQTDRPGRS